MTADILSPTPARILAAMTPGERHLLTWAVAMRIAVLKCPSPDRPNVQDNFEVIPHLKTRGELR